MRGCGQFALLLSLSAIHSVDAVQLPDVGATPGWTLSIPVLLAAAVAVHRAISRPYKFPSPAFSPGVAELDVNALSFPELEKLILSKDAGLVLVPGTEHSITWYQGARKQDICILYVHGWSASPVEYRTVARELARKMGANLLTMRLSGHGRAEEGGRPLLHENSPAHLFRDVADGMLVAQRLGHRVVGLGSSTGGALLTWAAAQPRFAPSMEGLLLISPAFNFSAASVSALAGFLGVVRRVAPASLTRTVGEAVLRAAVGETKVPPIIKSEGHGRFWTLRYPSAALLTLFEVVWEIPRSDLSGMACPVLCVGCWADAAIDWGYTLGLLRRQFRHVTTAAVALAASETRDSHSIGADVVGEDASSRVAGIMEGFWRDSFAAGRRTEG